MSALTNLPPELQAFLDRIATESREGPVSMYEVGQTLGLDRNAARQAGEELIGQGFLEIVSLSGSVALTEQGRAASGADAQSADSAPGGRAEVVDAAARLGLEGVEVKVTPLSRELNKEMQALIFDLALANQLGSGSGSAASHLTALAGLLIEPSSSLGLVRECLTGAALGLDLKDLDPALDGRLREMLTRLWSAD